MSPYQYICSPSNSVTSLNTYLCVMTFLVDTHMLPLKKISQADQHIGHVS
jgi:hypothetical protein